MAPVYVSHKAKLWSSTTNLFQPRETVSCTDLHVATSGRGSGIESEPVAKMDSCSVPGSGENELDLSGSKRVRLAHVPVVQLTRGRMNRAEPVSNKAVLASSPVSGWEATEGFLVLGRDNLQLLRRSADRETRVPLRTMSASLFHGKEPSLLAYLVVGSTEPLRHRHIDIGVVGLSGRDRQAEPGTSEDGLLGRT